MFFLHPHTKKWRRTIVRETVLCALEPPLNGSESSFCFTFQNRTVRCTRLAEDSRSGCGSSKDTICCAFAATALGCPACTSHSTGLESRQTARISDIKRMSRHCRLLESHECEVYVVIDRSHRPSDKSKSSIFLLSICR